MLTKLEFIADSAAVILDSLKCRPQPLDLVCLLNDL
jgi:hypothetical protein